MADIKLAVSNHGVATSGIEKLDSSAQEDASAMSATETVTPKMSNFEWQEFLSESAVSGFEEGTLHEMDNGIENLQVKPAMNRKVDKADWREFASDPGINLSAVNVTLQRRHSYDAVRTKNGPNWGQFFSASHLLNGQEKSPISSSLKSGDVMATRQEATQPEGEDLKEDQWMTLNVMTTSQETDSHHGLVDRDSPMVTEVTTTIAHDRQASANLPIRPLTIGNNETIGNTLVYRPLSPFDPDLYPSRTASSTPVIPSTSQVSLHAGGNGHDADTDDRGADMSARERLQPLGRDGLEVKQGPPWGVTIPMFQPHSRSSSMSSNDSNSSINNINFVRLQTMTLKTDTDVPAISDGQLSRKSSVKSLESKEPLPAMQMTGEEAKTPKTQLARFHDLHAKIGDTESPVSRILGPTFKTTEKILQDLKRRPLGLEVESHSEDDALKIPAVREPVMDAGNDLVKDDNSNEPSLVQNDISEIKKSDSDYVPVSFPSWQHFGDLTSKREHGSFGESDRVLEHVSRTSESGGSRDFEILGGSGQYGGSKDTQAIGGGVLPDNVASSDRITLPSSMAGSRQVAVRTTEPSTDDARSQMGGSHDFETLGGSGLYGRSEHNQAIGSGGVASSDRASSRKVDSVRRTYSFKDDTRTQMGGSHDFEILDGSGQYERSEDTKTGSGLPPGKMVSSDRTSLPGDMANTGKGDSVRSTDTFKEGTHTQMKENINGSTHESLSWDNMLDARPTAGKISEFDRVASQSISLSNAVANSFREELSRSFDLLEVESDEEGTLTDNEPEAVLDSGLSETTTNEDIYLPKGLEPLNRQQGPVGIYDVRMSCGPGSTSRRRHALGRPGPKASPIVASGVYVSEGTTELSSTEVEDKGIESQPDGQSTPKSDEGSMIENGSHEYRKGPTTTSGTMAEIHTSVDGNQEYKRGPHRTSRTIAEVHRSTNGNHEHRRGPHRKSGTTAEVHTSTDGNHEYRRDPVKKSGTVAEVHTPTDGNLEYRRGPHKTHGTVHTSTDYTWSVKTPVMSQLNTETKPLVVAETKQRKAHDRNEKDPSQDRRRVSRQKDPGKKTRHHVSTRTSENTSSSNSSYQERGAGHRQATKNVADVILENFRREEQEQKKRQRKMEQLKHTQSKTDLNELWDRFQYLLGKTSSKKHSLTLSSLHTPRSQLSTLTDSEISISESTMPQNKTPESGTTDSEEELQKFLRRVREVQSSISESTDSRHSGHERRRRHHDHPRSGNVLHRKPHRHTPDTSDKTTSDKSSDFETPLSIPMWLGAGRKNPQKKLGNGYSVCTCGTRDEKITSKAVRDVGVNCPTPPVVATNFPQPPVALNGPTPPVLANGPNPSIVNHDLNIVNLTRGLADENRQTNDLPSSLVKLSLQDAFMYSNQDFIRRSRERVSRIKEKKKEDNRGPPVIIPTGRTKMVKEKEDEVLKTVVSKPLKLYDQLAQKKPRPMTQKEIRNVNKRMYKNLPEVKKRKEEERRASRYQTNRLRAQLYGKHVRNLNRMYTGP